eukprot:7186442-Prymnesium_polylepis.1
MALSTHATQWPHANRTSRLLSRQMVHERPSSGNTEAASPEPAAATALGSGGDTSGGAASAIASSSL